MTDDIDIYRSAILTVVTVIAAGLTAMGINDLLTMIQRTFDWTKSVHQQNVPVGEIAMANSNYIIQDMLDALHNEFGACQKFEDVPASVLESENTDQAQSIDLQKFMKDAAA